MFYIYSLTYDHNWAIGTEISFNAPCNSNSNHHLTRSDFMTIFIVVVKQITAVIKQIWLSQWIFFFFARKQQKIVIM